MFIFYFISFAQALLPNANLTIGPLLQSIADDEDLDQIVYVNKVVKENFDLSTFPSYSCCPNNVTKFRVMNLKSTGANIQRFNLPFYIENLGTEPIQIESLTITEELSDQNIQVDYFYRKDVPIIQGFDNYMGINITHLCYKSLNNDRYWSIKKVSLQFTGYDPITFNYQFLCGKDYYPVRFDWSNIILIAVESVIILLLSLFGRIYAFKIVFITDKLKQELSKERLDQLSKEVPPFQGFILYWPQGLIYISLLLGSLFVSLYAGEKAENPIQIVVYILCCLCAFHFVNELFCAFRKQIPFLVKEICLFRVCDVLSLIVGGGLFAAYIATSQAWWFSNILSFCILGSLIKCFKMTSLKYCLQFILPIIAIDLFCSIYLALSVRYEWDSLILRYFNTPLSGQLPYFRIIYKKKCAWVSIFNILFPGFFLGYVHRFDRLKQTFVYEIVSFFGLIIGLSLWVIVQYLTSFPLPTSIFTEILMICTCTLIAFTRNEVNLFWSGKFYDEILENPFKNEMDKKSVKVIHFLNIGVSKDLRKQMSKNSAGETITKKADAYELVQANNAGDLRLDSILFVGLYSIEDHPPQVTFRASHQGEQQGPSSNQLTNNTADTKIQQDINTIDTKLQQDVIIDKDNNIPQEKPIRIHYQQEEDQNLIIIQEVIDFSNPLDRQKQKQNQEDEEKKKIKPVFSYIVAPSGPVNPISIEPMKQSGSFNSQTNNPPQNNNFSQNQQQNECDTPKLPNPMQSDKPEQSKQPEQIQFPEQIKQSSQIKQPSQIQQPQQIQQPSQEQNPQSTEQPQQIKSSQPQQEKQTSQIKNSQPTQKEESKKDGLKVYSSPARLKYGDVKKEEKVDRFQQKQQLRSQQNQSGNNEFQKKLEYFKGLEKK